MGSPEEIAAICARLKKARDALESLLTGTSEASLTYRERTIVYRSTNIDDLYKYIALLENELRMAKGLPMRARRHTVLW